MREMNSASPVIGHTSKSKRSSSIASSRSNNSSTNNQNRSSPPSSPQASVLDDGFVTARAFQVHQTIKPTAKILTVAPESGRSNLGTAATQKSYTFMAQMDFNKPSANGFLQPKMSEINVSECFHKWIQRTRAVTPTFILHPYEDKDELPVGHQITHEDQLPKDDVETYMMYYHNHRINARGTLTGMVKFSMNCPWWELKDMKKPYFGWLQANSVFLKQTSFQADTLALAGWIYGAHHDVTRKDDAYKELRNRLDLPMNIHFQLVPRTLNVTESKGSKNRFSFKAVAVEADGKHIARLREAFYKLGDPSNERERWPVTGQFLFVPMLETIAWSHMQILSMAKAHTRVMSQLEQIFIGNVQDIDTLLISGNMQDTVRSLILRARAPNGISFVHSVHRTTKENVFSVLVEKSNIRYADAFFGDIHARLYEALPSTCHPHIFL
jgi:hypothetical protein